MKIINKIVCVILVIAMIPVVNKTKAVFIEDINKQYCSATLDDNFVDNQIIIVVMPFANFYEYTIDSFSDIKCIDLKELTYEICQNKLCRIIELTLNEHSKQYVLNAIKILEKRDDIYSAEPNYIESLCEDLSEDKENPELTPNDEYYLYDKQWAIDAINLTSAWSITTGESTIRVGIIDSGIDAEHIEFSGRINTSLSKCFSSYYSTALEDEGGHGTMVAGIIGATGNNARGVAGTGWNIELVSLRVTNESGGMDTAAVTAAINYAQANGIQVLNYSGGAYYSDDSVGIVYNRKVAIQNYEGLLICSCGNKGRNVNVSQHFPSGHNKFNNVISVGSINESLEKSGFSNFGCTSVDLFAPGENILTTYPTSMCEGHTVDDTPGHVDVGYHTNGGTSLAAPFVTGVAALMLSIYPSLTPTQIKQILIQTVIPVETLSDLCVSGGYIDAYKAVYYSKCLATSISYYFEFDADYHTYYYKKCGPDSGCDSPDSCESIDGCEACGYNCWGNMYIKHNLICANYDVTQHTMMCTDCDYMTSNSHELFYSANYANHKWICKLCPYSSNEATHSLYYSYDQLSSSAKKEKHLVICGICNCIYEEKHNFIVYGTSLYKCTICGYILNIME